MGIHLSELETFIAVAELASFSLAAQRLHVSQPTVTGRVQRLETVLGAQLLLRTTRRVETTAEGALLLAEATQVMTGLRKLVTRFRYKARLARQRVVVAATPMLASLILPPIIRDYSKRFIDVQLSLRDLRYEEALDAVAAGSADIAVLAYEGRDSRFRTQALSKDDVVLVTPASHPLAGSTSVMLEQLAAQPLLVIEQYEPMHTLIAQALTERGLSVAPVTTVGSLHTLLGMVEAELGATLLPRSIAQRSRKTDQTIIELRDFKLERRFFIVRSRKSELSTAAESFIKFLRQAMG